VISQYFYTTLNNMRRFIFLSRNILKNYRQLHSVQLVTEYGKVIPPSKKDTLQNLESVLSF